MSDVPPADPTLPPHTAAYTPNPDATRPPAPASGGSADGVPAWAGRIELRGELARGGMGAVLRGHDPALDREVAVKVLLGSHAGRPDIERRFVEEAQITGQLQHPGVVPVHDLGRFADGRPFFAMKLVAGRTLAELLAERPTPAHDLPRFLHVFEQVGQAVAFAHSRRVIHRDLKPLNVMVGAFGEVQVMDWGLAKQLGGGVVRSGGGEKPPYATTPPPHQPTTSPPERTQAGATLGTLAYMPPEQARGEGERVDERADVFGLGAILCEILTGRPPYTGGAEQVWWMAFNADLAPAFARLDGCGADPELIALAKTCLAAEPADRPRDAGAVAAAVGAYLSGVQERLRRAELDRAAAEARAAEERKRRRVQLALAASVLFTVLGAAGGGLWLQREHAARAAETARVQAEAEQRVAVAVQKARLLEGQGQAAAALAAAEQARDLADDDRVTAATRQDVVALAQALRAEAEQAQRDQTLLDRLQDAGDIAEDALAPFAGDARAHREYLFYYYAHAYRSWGADLDQHSDDEILARVRARPAAVRRELAAGLDHWAWHARLQHKPAALWHRLLRLAAAADPDADPVRAELRALAERDRLSTEATAGAVARAVLPLTAAADLITGADRRRLRELAERADPAAVPAQTLALLAAELHVAGDAARAVTLLLAAVRARPGDVLLHDRLAHSLFDLTPPHWAEAIPHLETVRALRPRRAARLAMILVEVGRVDEALALCRAAEQTRSDPATPYLRVGQVLADKGRIGAALPFFQAVARLAPDDRWAGFQLGLAHERRTEFAEAAAAFRRAADLPPTTRPDPRLADLDRHTQTASRQGLDRCQRLAALDARLPAVLAGREQVTPAERCDLAMICLYRRQCRDSARLFAEAFAGDPRLADRPNIHCYNAACAAARAATGRSADTPDEAERARLRRQALDWLRADLAAVERRLAGGRPADRAEVRRLLRHWQADDDLAGLRDPTDLAAIPPGDRSAWQALWNDVADLLRRAEAP